MGGHGSGRFRGRPAIDSGLILDLNELKRDGALKNQTGSLGWFNGEGDCIASLGYYAHLEEKGGWLRLHYTYTSGDGDKHDQNYRINIVSTPQPFGGRRLWFICPRTTDRAVKLYMPKGTTTFASRGAYRLGYRSQRLSIYDRAAQQALKLRRRLGDDGEGDGIVKPKWMRHRTFENQLARIEAHEEIADEKLLIAAWRLLGLGRG